MSVRRLRLPILTVVAALLGAWLVAVPAHAAGNVVTGTVVKKTGTSEAALAGASVYLDRVKADGFTDSAYASGETNAQGVFTITKRSSDGAALPNGNYQVRIYPRSYGRPGDLGYEYYKNKWSPYGSTIISVTGGKVTLDKVVLEQTGWATGKVTGLSEGSMSDVSVSVSDGPDAGGYGFSVNSDGTFDTREGEWTKNMIPGTYVITASYHGYAADGPVYADASATVTIRPGQQTVVPALQLKRRKTVVFTATDSTGRPLQYAPVGLWIQDAKTGVYGGAQYGPIQTDGNGRFRMVEGRNYQVQFYPDAKAPAGDVAEYWDGASGSYALQDAVAVTWPSAAPVKRSYAVQLGSAPAITQGTVTIKGTPRLGNRLTVKTTDWPRSAALKIRWEADGVPVRKATKRKLKVTKKVAKAVKVEARVTAIRSGDKAVDAVSPAKNVEPAKLTPTTPTVSGTPKVGKRLKVRPGAWKPKKVSFTYQWFRGSKRIAGATKATYKLAKADRGKRLKVKVTGSKRGYATTSRSSRATAKIRR